MTDNDEPIRRFRCEVPPPNEAAWAAVRGAVAREIAAELGRPRHGRGLTRRRAPRLLAVGLAALVLTGAVAYGATTLIGVGSPAPNPPSPFTPSNISSSACALPIPRADRRGGSGWPSHDPSSAQEDRTWQYRSGASSMVRWASSAKTAPSTTTISSMPPGRTAR